MTRVVSFVALIGIVILVSVLVFQVMASFLLPMFLAIVMVVVFRPMHRWFFDRFNGRNRLASIVTTAVIMLIVLAPFLPSPLVELLGSKGVGARIEHGSDGTWIVYFWRRND